MKKAKFYTPVVTAFDADGNLDIQANKNIYDFLIQAGIDGLVIMGSTGEFFAMSTAEKKQLIDLAVSHVDKRTKVFIGTGCMSVEDTIELSNYAISAGADAVMVISPYYFALSAESVELFYDQVAEAVKGDIYLYNFPARTGHDLSAQVTLNLLRKHKNIVGYKDTVTEMAHTRTLIRTVRDEFPDFEILSGFEEFFAHNLLSGGDGCIGGLSNIYPELFVEWRNAMDAKDVDRIKDAQRKVDRMTALYDVGTPFIPIVKKAMKMRGIEMQDTCKKPFIAADARQTEAIRAVLRGLNLI